MPGNDYVTDLVRFIHENVAGQTFKRMGEKIGVSEGMMSRVASGNRSLSLDRFFGLAHAYKLALPVLLAAAVKEEHIPEKLRPGYEDFRKIVRQFYSEKLILNF